MSTQSALEPVLEENDVRAMVRLLGEVAALPGDHTAKKAHLIQGVCTLIDADKWGWALICDMAADRPPLAASFMHGGFSEKQFVHFLMALEHSDTRRTNAAIIEEFRIHPRHITRLREQIDPENIALQLQVAEHWEAAGIRGVIMSIRPLSTTSQSAVGLYRDLSKPHFTPRESRIAHIILSEVGWLHEQGWPEDHAATVPQLAPRQRLVLHLLLEGQGRKDIAHHMGISINTVAGYVKEVFRHFEVCSQAALMRRFQHGDGGDGLPPKRRKPVQHLAQLIIAALLPDMVPGVLADLLLA